MSLLYNFGIYLTRIVLYLIAPFNSKIKLGVKGREKTFDILKKRIKPADKVLWFHCASLGEYEQGLPVFTKLKNEKPNHKILLTFFSPSGYEIRKNSPIADVVAYLPLDTPTAAKRFLRLIKPELTVFVKYDIWPNFLIELKKQNLKAILISAAFRKNQSFFKFYGNQLRKALFSFEHIFTQNQESKLLLESIYYRNVTISGDTRFDRVYSQLEQNNTLEFISEFKQDKLCIVAGSTWPEDETLFIEFINSKASENLKLIIAPHNIKASQIHNFRSKLNVQSVLFSEKNNFNLQKATIFIIDTIGLLTKIYNYADIAYVGGAMGNTGLHNTLEPAVFGIPIVIGKNHSKFPEAKAFIDNGGMLSISSQEEFNTILNILCLDEEKRTLLGEKNIQFIKKNKGAVIQIVNYLRI